MVRATYAEVKKLNSGKDFAGWAEAAVTNLCAIVDDELDEYELDTSGQGPVTLANMLVYRRIIHQQWVAGGRDGYEPVIWTQDLLDLRNRLSGEGTHKFFAATDMVED